MKTVKWLVLVIIGCALQLKNIRAAMTMVQLESSLSTMRTICAPKYKASKDLLDGIKDGTFVDDKELKCYTSCIAQMAGTLNKKGEVSLPKTLAQIEGMLPLDLKEPAKAAALACKDIQNGYKDSCDKVFFTIKCVYEHNPEVFLFP